MTDNLSPVVRTRSLIVGYSGKAAATIPDLDLVGGLVWHVTGSNGSGKTALLKTLAGLLRPVSGRVERRCGTGVGGAIYVHSVPYLFAGSVRRNLTLAHAHQNGVQEAADAFGLSALLGCEATTLSHGQQRRLALARALVGRPSLLLVDEPEGGLDDEAISAWRACAVRAVQMGGATLVVAAHRPLAFQAIPVREVRLSERFDCPGEINEGHSTNLPIPPGRRIARSLDSDVFAPVELEALNAAPPSRIRSTTV